MAGHNVLVFQDSDLFGGHEVMFLNLLPALLEHSDIEQVTVVYPEANRTLSTALAQISCDKLSLKASVFTKGRGEPYAAPFRRRYAQHVDRILDASRPSFVLLLQGRIENCLVPMLRSSARGIRVLSYVPMAHSMKEAGSAFSMFGLADVVRRKYYQTPNAYIVPSRSVGRQLRARGAIAPIAIVENVAASVRPVPREAALAQLGLGSGTHLGSFIGRLDAYQKGLDRLIRCIETLGPDAGGWHFLLVGSGPSQRDLEAACSQRGIRNAITFIPWTEDLATVYAASNVVLLPSRFEGVPLVMLEALAYGTPVLGSEIDVFQEYLPPACRFSFDPVDDFRGALSRVIEGETQTTFHRQARTIVARNSPATARTAFKSVVDAILNSQARGSPAPWFDDAWAMVGIGQ